MLTIEEFPELKAVFDKLMSEKESIESYSRPLRDRYNELQALVDPWQIEMKSLSIKIKEIEHPRLGEICNRLSVIARSLGGKSTSQGL